MNILIVEEHDGQLSTLVDLLRHEGHALRVTPTATAGAMLEKVGPDLAIVSSADPNFAALARALHATEVEEDRRCRTVLAIAPADTVEARTQAYENGADAVAAQTAGPRELVEHVRFAERIVRLERKLGERVQELESALRRLALVANVRGQGVAAKTAQPARGDIRFLLTHAWSDVDDTLCNMCCEYLQNKFTQVVGTASIPVGSPGAKISLTDVDNELDLELTFFTPAHCAPRIAGMFAGGEPIAEDEVIKDVLLELSNSAMGAVRAAFLSEEFRFAASTPKPAIAGQIDRLLDRVEAKRVLTFNHDGAVLHAVVAVRHNGKLKVKATALREGMVVTSDVRNDGGLLLVRAGTRLTETTADKIARLVPKAEIEIAETA